MASVSIDTVCTALEQILIAQLPTALAQQGAMREAPTALQPVLSWAQLPSRQALFSAEMPVGAITTPGLVGTPTRDQDGHYRATWLLAVAVYARGANHRDTSQRLRGYAAAVRDVVVANPSLAGVVSGVRWTHEEYALLDPRSARTEGGCLVEVEVDLEDVVQPGAGVTVVGEVTAALTLLPVHPAL